MAFKLFKKDEAMRGRASNACSTPKISFSTCGSLHFNRAAIEDFGLAQYKSVAIWIDQNDGSIAFDLSTQEPNGDQLRVHSYKGKNGRPIVSLSSTTLMKFLNIDRTCRLELKVKETTGKVLVGNLNELDYTPRKRARGFKIVDNLTEII